MHTNCFRIWIFCLIQSSLWRLCWGDAVLYVIIFLNFSTVVIMVLFDSKWFSVLIPWGKGRKDVERAALSARSRISWCYHLVLIEPRCSEQIIGSNCWRAAWRHGPGGSWTFRLLCCAIWMKVEHPGWLEFPGLPSAPQHWAPLAPPVVRTSRLDLHDGNPF